MPEDKTLDVSQVASRLGISPSSVYRLLKAGEIQGAPLGPKRGVQIWESSVEDFIERRTRVFQAEIQA